MSNFFSRMLQALLILLLWEDICNVDYMCILEYLKTLVFSELLLLVMPWFTISADWYMFATSLKVSIAKICRCSEGDNVYKV